LVKIAVLKGGWVTLSTNFRRNRGCLSTTVGIRKIESLGYHTILRLSVLTQYRRVTDRRTNRQTDTR